MQQKEHLHAKFVKEVGTQRYMQTFVNHNVGKEYQYKINGMIK